MDKTVNLKKKTFTRAIIVVLVLVMLVTLSIFNLEDLKKLGVTAAQKLGIYSDQYYCDMLADDFEVGDPILLPEEIKISSANDFWELYLIQPVITEYYQKDGINYAKGVIEDAKGECHKLTFVLSGKIKSKTFSDVNEKFKKVVLDNKYVTLEDFQTKIKPGTQVGAYYLGKKTESLELTENLCLSSPSYKYFCNIESITNDYSDGFIKQIKSTDDLKKLPTLFIPTWKTKVV